VAYEIGHSMTVRNMRPASVAVGRVVLTGVLAPEPDDHGSQRGTAYFDTWSREGQPPSPDENQEVKVGETFEVGGQTWRLDSVSKEAPDRSSAVISRES
jgi:hypothetical protein